MQPRYTNKTVIITGAGTGMGRSAALRLAGEGAQVVLLGRRLGPLEQVAAEIVAREGAGASPAVIACDVSCESEVAAAVREATAVSGRLDALFANAGVLGDFTPLVKTGLADFNVLIATNLLGTFLTVKHCAPLMEGGAVLINASWTANGVMPGAGAYAATKAALLALTRTLAMELGGRNIRVNAISPGVILTPMAEAALAPEIAARLASQAALGRNGTPEDVSGAVAWLLSDDAAFVTGQEISVDGGFTLAGPRLQGPAAS